MTYEETIQKLFDILTQCNAADSNSAENWQEPTDANEQNGAFGHVTRAIDALAGADVLSHWCETGELWMELCERKPAVRFKECWGGGLELWCPKHGYDADCPE